MRWSTFGLLLPIVLFLAYYYRFPDLGLRPMHTDEANLGVKFLDFWRTGVFHYNPDDHHGPLLHFITRAYAWIAHWHDPLLVTEAGLRSVVAVTGVLVVLVTLLLTDVLGRMATIMAMLMMAVSPIMVFYSRYFIMEMLFVLLLALFIIACWRFAQGRSILWLLAAGVCLGGLHATKETFVINMAAMFCGWVVARQLTEGFVVRTSGLRLNMGRKRGGIRHPALWILVIGVAVSVTLFSGLYRHWDDVVASVTTYSSYWKRSGGAGGHEKPWYYYALLLFWAHGEDGKLWTEALVGGLALLGILHAFFGTFRRETAHRQAFLIFLSVYALAALTAYSLIPYKTPWTILSVQWAFILLAGVGAQALFAAFQGRFMRLILGLGLVAGCLHLCRQSIAAVHDPQAARHHLNQANLNVPYAYTHTGFDALKLITRLRELAAVGRGDFSAQVIGVDSGWPLPWYLRDLQTIGYQTTVPADLKAPVIVVDAGLKKAVEAKIDIKAYEQPNFALRPGVFVVLLVEKGLWDRLLAAKQEAAGKKP